MSQQLQLFLISHHCRRRQWWQSSIPDVPPLCPCCPLAQAYTRRYFLSFSYPRVAPLSHPQGFFRAAHINLLMPAKVTFSTRRGCPCCPCCCCCCCRFSYLLTLLKIFLPTCVLFLMYPLFSLRLPLALSPSLSLFLSLKSEQKYFHKFYLKLLLLLVFFACCCCLFYCCCCCFWCVLPKILTQRHNKLRQYTCTNTPVRMRVRACACC